MFLCFCCYKDTMQAEYFANFFQKFLYFFQKKSFFCIFLKKKLYFY